MLYFYEKFLSFFFISVSAAPYLRGPNKKIGGVGAVGEIEIINKIKITDKIKAVDETKTIKKNERNNN